MPANGPNRRRRLATAGGTGEQDALPSVADRDHYQAMLVSNLDVIESVISYVCHRHSVIDAGEFGSEVKLKLVENDYEILRKFQHRSTLRTYLTIVVQRIYLDYRNHLWGKWRPSAEARRLGPVAIRLETLMVRDGYGFAEASVHLRTNDGVAETERDLYEIAIRLPLRLRHAMCGEDAIEDLPDTATELDDGVSSEERMARARRIQGALAAATEALGDQDRLILRLRFQEGLARADIARALHLDEKPFYRRFAALLRHLRESLESSGIDRAEAGDIIARKDTDISLALLGQTAAATPAAPPSESNEALGKP
jgi:RNA polymerase sigma factor for flagellar operon FliA